MTEKEPTMSDFTEDKTAPRKTGQREKRALKIIAALLLSCILLAGGFLAGYFSVDVRARSLAWMADRVAENYVDGAEKDDLYDRMYDALQLDKFCTHYTPSEYERVVSESEGNNEGYGLSLSGLDERARVYNVVYNSPADRAGVASGMYILRFGASEGELKAGTREETLAFLRGSTSCAVECGYREDGKDARVFHLKREKFLGSYVYYADAEGTYKFRGEKFLSLERVGEGMSVPENTAYIRLTEFDGAAGAEFLACLTRMKNAGRHDLVLDLRSDGGGYLDILCDIASHLLKRAEGSRPLVASAPDYAGGEEYRAYGNDYSSFFEEDARIRVLLDENTASASESLVSAMLDYGTISEEDIYIRKGEDGAHSYGKGVMQTHFTAPDGNVLRLTVSRILSPSGRCIHGTGFVAADEAHAVDAPLLPAGEDEFLRYLFS